MKIQLSKNNNVDPNFTCLACRANLRARKKIIRKDISLSYTIADKDVGPKAKVLKAEVKKALSKVTLAGVKKDVNALRDIFLQQSGLGKYAGEGIFLNLRAISARIWAHSQAAKALKPTTNSYITKAKPSGHFEFANTPIVYERNF